jgi:signal peptidase II
MRAPAAAVRFGMRARPWILLVVASLVLLVGCDHATKYAAQRELRDERATPVIRGAVVLEYHENHGVAFNNERVLPASARTPLIFGVGILAMGVLAVALWRRRGKTNVETAALVLVAGGAAGNLIDRVARGYVVDFVHVEHWPVFNLADVWLVVGAALLVIASMRASTRGPMSARSRT